MPEDEIQSDGPLGEIESIPVASRHERRAEKLKAIAARCAERPIHDTRSAEELVGYDSHGAP